VKQLFPAFRFLGIFLGCYLVSNLLYGLWIESYHNQPDAITRLVTKQVTTCLRAWGEDIHDTVSLSRPSVSIMTDEHTVVVNVYEGCNGINVLIVFLSFIIAFGGSWRKALWFIPLGIGLIYLANLVRVGALYGVARYYQPYFYYVHKYFFTASIYLLVLLLWWFWIEKVNQLSIRDSFTRTDE
jgi:exosortase family protein XrtF